MTFQYYRCWQLRVRFSIKWKSLSSCIFSIQTLNYALLFLLKIITLETNRFRQKCLESLIAENKLENKIIVINSAVHQLKQHDLENLTVKFFCYWFFLKTKYEDLFDFKIDVVMSECSFCQALLPWDNLYYFYGLEHLFRTIDTNVKQSVNVMPIRIRFCAVAISMQDLHKIRYPVGSSEGFSLAEFDKVILVSAKFSLIIT